MLHWWQDLSLRCLCLRVAHGPDLGPWTQTHLYDTTRPRVPAGISSHIAGYCWLAQSALSQPLAPPKLSAKLDAVQ